MIATGANWGFTIEKALKASRSVLVFWTPKSVESEEVYSEADYGLRINSLFPILLEPCEVPQRMQRIQYVDFTASDARHPVMFDRLLSNIKERVGIG